MERRDLVALIDSAMNGPVSLDVVLYATRSKNEVWFMFKFIFAENRETGNDASLKTISLYYLIKDNFQEIFSRVYRTISSKFRE